MKGTLCALGVLGLLTATACAPQGQNAAIGNSGSGIIGGTTVKEGDPIAKSIVGLVMEINANNSSQSAYLSRKKKPTPGSQPSDPGQGRQMYAICTGTLVTENVILTAAHCMDADISKAVVVFGDDFSAAFDKNATKKPSIETRQVVNWSINPLWARAKNEQFNEGDTAVVKFDGSLPEGYAPAQILPDASALRNGADVVVAGYGADRKISGDANTSGDSAGVGTLRKVTVQIVNAKISQTEMEIGARQKTVCHGDSGGPSFIELNGEYYLWGVTSRGDCQQESIQTNILAYLDNWLKPTVAKLENSNSNGRLSDLQIANF